MRHYVFKGIILYLIMGLGLHIGCVSSDEEAPLPSPVAQANEISDAGFSQNDSGVLVIDSGTQTSVVPSQSDSGAQDWLPVDGGSVVNTPFTDAGYLENILDSGSAVWHDAGIQTALQTDSGVMVAEDFLPLTDTSCSALCLSRSENTNGYGGCEFSWLSGNCETRCLDMNVFSSQTQAAFANCTLYDPLCYLDIEQCMWGQRYPWPETTTITTTFSGTGFSDFNGHTVRIAIDGSPETYSYAPNQVVTNGEFEVTWDIDSNPNASNLFMYYIDVDADGSCDASIDYAGSLHGTLVPNWDTVTLFGEDTYDNNNHAFVCDYID